MFDVEEHSFLPFFLRTLTSSCGCVLRVLRIGKGNLLVFTNYANNTPTHEEREGHKKSLFPYGSKDNHPAAYASLSSRGRINIKKLRHSLEHPQTPFPFRGRQEEQQLKLSICHHASSSCKTCACVIPIWAPCRCRYHRYSHDVFLGKSNLLMEM